MSETWDQQHERETAEHIAKAKKSYAQYQADPTKRLLSKERDRGRKLTDYTYEDWVKDTDDEHRVKTTRFQVCDDGTVWMWVRVTKSQKFLCVNGPLVGQKVTPDNDVDYVLYNCAGRAEDAPKCVLVYKPSGVKLA